LRKFQLVATSRLLVPTAGPKAFRRSEQPLAAGPCGRSDVVFGGLQDLEADDVPIGPSARRLPSRVALACFLFLLGFVWLTISCNRPNCQRASSDPAGRRFDAFGRSSRSNASQPAVVSFVPFPTFTGDKGHTTGFPPEVNTLPIIFARAWFPLAQDGLGPLAL